MIIAEQRKIIIQLEQECPDVFDRIIKRIDEMRFISEEDDILDLLGGRIDLDHISGESIPREVFGSHDKLVLIYSHSDDLVADRRIIEISSEQEKDQDCTDEIIAQEREHKNDSEHYREDQIPHLAFLEFLPIVDKHAHQIT